MTKIKSLEAFTLNSSFYRLGNGLSALATPQAIECPKLVKHNIAVAELIGISNQCFTTPEFINIFSGNQLPVGAIPAAQSYAGHQFGHFNPFLGDGRSILLDDICSQYGTWELCLKGAGKTPFSFASDGRAGLTECLREYELSEQLATYGIPTTHCLCVVKGNQKVYRSGFESVTMLTRVATSHVRFGNFENCYFKKDLRALKILADYVIEKDFPHCINDKRNGENNYKLFFQEVVTRTAHLIAQWQSVGFVHGMMNTDNQSILGVTLDFGESQFTKEFDEEFVSSSADEKGRYAFGQQPLIGLWNCNVLAKALSPIISSKHLKQGLLLYEPAYLNKSEELARDR